MANERKVSAGDVNQPAMVSRSVGYAMRRAQMRVQEALFATLNDLGTTPVRYNLLLLVRENPGIRSVDLAHVIGVAQSRIVKLVDDLEVCGLISRRVSPSDRRNRVLVLTPGGERKLRQLEQRVKRHEARLTERLDESERERLLGLLSRVALPTDR